jgi:putative transposase
MSIHSCSRIWLHLIWSTHKREKLLTADAAMAVSEYLFKYSKEKGIFMAINYINYDHAHSLIDLPTDQTIENCVKLFKGSTSYYINQEKLIPGKFNWGRGYGAFSVSQSQYNKVFEYIKNQKEHHRIKSFTEEFEAFEIKYNLAGALKDWD